MDKELEKVVSEIRKDIKQIKSDVKNLTDETSKDYVQGLIDNVKEEESQWTCNYCGGDMMIVEYDYIGAPWCKNQDDNLKHVGNGGFSLRTREKMIECIKTVKPDDLILGESTKSYIKNTKSILSNLILRGIQKKHDKKMNVLSISILYFVYLELKDRYPKLFGWTKRVKKYFKKMVKWCKFPYICL